MFLKRFSYNRRLSNFTDIRPVIQQIRTDTRKDGRTGGHDEAIGRSSSLYERAYQYERTDVNTYWYSFVITNKINEDTLHFLSADTSGVRTDTSLSPK